jgi:hypothetical protein
MINQGPSKTVFYTAFVFKITEYLDKL